MGEKQNVESVLFYWKDGQFETVKPILTVDDTDLTPYLATDDDGEWMMKPPKLDGCQISGTFKLPKHFRCHSRKRLVKLLMSHGVPRNKAVIMANLGKSMGYSFAWIYYRILTNTER